MLGINSYSDITQYGNSFRDELKDGYGQIINHTRC